jgi:ubiquinone/menaquinone biosynthesis C-methylase UbiE
MGIIARHFSRIARIYGNVRTTDLEPVFFIRDRLKSAGEVVAADVGCGDGRYGLQLLQHLENLRHLYCVDPSKGMLKQVKRHGRRHGLRNFETKVGLADDLPLGNESLDCVFSFNAVHLFDLRRFLVESVRVLREGGTLFLYTRTQSQNAQSFWGTYFPKFEEKENRLSDLEDLKATVRDAYGFVLEDVKLFEYQRNASLARLREQAKDHHYSTFSFYTKEEFEMALRRFTEILKNRFEDSENIPWTDGNMLLVARKT